MTPVEELRAAAARMRELAEKAPAGDVWYATSGPEDTAHVWAKTASVIPDHVAQIDSDEAERDLATSRHMAAWHPAVALAVADLLDDTAERAGTFGVLTGSVVIDSKALAVARAFLGGAT